MDGLVVDQLDWSLGRSAQSNYIPFELILLALFSKYFLNLIIEFKSPGAMLFDTRLFYFEATREFSQLNYLIRHSLFSLYASLTVIEEIPSIYYLIQRDHMILVLLPTATVKPTGDCTRYLSPTPW